MDGESTIGRYIVKSELGRGGMATVFRATDPTIGRDVAVKVLPQALLHDPSFRARFDREARTIAALEHTAIVPVYDFGEHEGQPYLVMRLMEGGSLADRLERGPLSPELAARILRQLGPALDKAHANGIIHRDLKPANILFDAEGSAYLSDFGIVKVSEGTAALTGSGIIGTPAYMSPEQINGQVLDGRSDIYALGVILYEMLTGRQPYPADTPAAILVKHITEPVPDVRTVNPALPEGVRRVVARAMAKEPADRYPTATALARALARAVSSTGRRAPAARTQAPATAVVDPPTPAPPTEVLPPPQSGGAGRRIVAGTVLLLLVAVVAFAGYLWSVRDNTTVFLPNPTLTPTAVVTPTETRADVVVLVPGETPTPFVAAETPTATLPPPVTDTPTPSIPPPGEVLAGQFAVAPVVDGVLGEWPEGGGTTLNVVKFLGRAAPPDHAAEWRLGWDNVNLYAAVVVTDDRHVQNQSGNQIFRGDSVEMYLDTDPGDPGPGLNGDDFQIIFSPGNFVGLPPSAFRFRGTPPRSFADAPGHAIVVAAQATATGYTLEAAVPWADLGVTPVVGRQLGLMLTANDNDDTAVASLEVQLANLPGASGTAINGDPSRWGTLTLR